MQQDSIHQLLLTWKTCSLLDIHVKTVFPPYSPPSSLTVGLLSGRWHWALELWSAPNKKTKLQLSVSHPNPPTFTQLGHLLLLHTFYFWASFTFVHILLLHIFYFFTPAVWLCVISLIWNVFYIHLFCTSKIIFSIFGKRQCKWKNFWYGAFGRKKTSYKIWHDMILNMQSLTILHDPCNE